jgi:hypothetical protein
MVGHLKQLALCSTIHIGRVAFKLGSSVSQSIENISRVQCQILRLSICFIFPRQIGANFLS